MRLLATRRAPPGTSMLGYADVEIGPVRIYGVEIRRTTAGDLRAWPPKRGADRMASIDADVAIQIASAALAVLEGSAHDPSDAR